MRFLLLIILSSAVALESKVDIKNPLWIRKIDGDNDIEIPDSPILDDNSEEAVTGNPIDDADSNKINSTKFSGVILKQNVKSEDLSIGYTPGYCRCVNKYYCSGPNHQRLRSIRAINTPPCTGRNEVMCCLTNGPGCGVPADFPYFNPYPLYGEANFADHPWLALIMAEDGKAIYGHGITIAWKTVITTARNVAAYKNRKFIVRLGEWDLANEDEPFKSQEFRVGEVIVHPKYDSRTFQNDIAVLTLTTSADLSSFPHIRSACLARPNENVKFRNAKCLVAGWGSEPSTRKMVKRQVRVAGDISKERTSRNILKEVDMQIMDGNQCQDNIRRAIKNNQFYLDQESFLCAGGDEGKGLCKGDEGAALVCQDTPTSRYTLVGMASWGTTCGEQGFPTVYTNMENYYSWIKSVAPDIGQ